MPQDPREIPGHVSGAITPEVVGPAGGGQERLTFWQRFFWIGMVLFTGAYIVMPLDFWPEMALGLVGLLDDGVAGMVLLFSLAKLGIRIPLLDRFVNRAGKKVKS